MPQVETMEMPLEWRKGHYGLTVTPRHFRICFRPVSGLVKKRIAFPWFKPQWHIDTFALTYRCGGSTGFAGLSGSPVSRLTRSPEGEWAPVTWRRF
jgi:hypothetical protein